MDFLVIRELTGGLYFGTPKGREMTPEGERAVDTLVYTEGEVRRIVRLAFQVAQKLTGFLIHQPAWLAIIIGRQR
mgnify:CR=1 FL=1